MTVARFCVNAPLHVSNESWVIFAVVGLVIAVVIVIAVVDVVDSISDVLRSHHFIPFKLLITTARRNRNLN